MHLLWKREEIILELFPHPSFKPRQRFAFEGFSEIKKRDLFNVERTFPLGRAFPFPDSSLRKEVGEKAK